MGSKFARRMISYLEDPGIDKEMRKEEENIQRGLLTRL